MIARSCVALCLVACGSGPPSPATPPASPPAPRPAVPSSTPPEPPPVATDEPSEPSIPTLHAIARANEKHGTLRVQRLGELAVATFGGHAYPIRGHRIDVENDLSEGWTWFGAVVGMAGKWPSNAWATYITSDGRVGWGELYRWKESAWIRQSTLSRAEVFLGISSWSKGRLLTLATETLPVRGLPRLTLRVVGGGPAPKPERGKGACPTETRPHGFAALESGWVFVFGQRCRADALEETVVESWAPGATRSTITTLPDVKLGGAWWEDSPVSALELGPGDVLLAAGSDFILRFDGTSFSRVAGVPSGNVMSLARASDGAVWAAIGESIQRWDTRSTWEPMRLPDGAGKPSSLVVSGDTVYVGAGQSLLSTKPPQGDVQVFDLRARFNARSFKVARPADKWCESVFVLLYAFTKVTPADYDFPLTRKALRGQTQFSSARFVVTEEAGKKYFGAFVPKLELAKQLAARIEKEVPGSKPALLCAEPVVVRELPLDLASGELSP